MAQGYSAYNIMNSAVSMGDSPSVDAFSRLRVSNPQILFASQMTYDLNPILMEQVVSGSGSTLSYSTTNRCANLVFSSTPSGGQCYMQSYEYLPYQPGRSQLTFVTFNMQSALAGVTKFAGLSDGVNGFEFQLSGTTKQFVIYSGSGNGNQIITQSNWNLDKLDGTGSSGLTLDISKVQILVIDFQALYVGRVRMGFDIGGRIIYAHEFVHANLVQLPYVQTANLPVRCGMTSTATVSTTMNFICCAIISEGGTDDINNFGYTFETNTSVTAAISGTQIFTLRPKLLFNGVPNRIRFTFLDLEIFNAGNQPVKWELLIGQSITGGTWSDINTLYSGTEVNTGATLSGNASILVDAGWSSATGGSKSSISSSINSKFPITLDAAGNNRALGNLTLKLTSLSGSQLCYAGIKFREIR